MFDKQELINFESEIATLWEAGKINAPIHLSGGNEDELIEIFKEIKPHDYIYTNHRNHYHALLHGVSPQLLMDEILGKSTGGCRGRARSMGFIDTSHNVYSSAIVGGCCAIAVGTAWALKESKSEKKVWCFIGDGAVDGGHFWEALQYAHGWDLPVTFIIEDNNRATCTDIVNRLGTKETLDGAWRTMLGSNKVIHYEYTPTYPHVGTGKYVQF